MLLRTIVISAIAPFVLVGVASPVRGDFVTNLTVLVSDTNQDLYTYNYTLINQDDSDVAAGAFFLDVPEEADLRSITGPAGWDILYTPGDTTIAWVSFGASTDLLPGHDAVFSFESPLLSGPRNFVVLGFTDTDFFSNTGQIAGPSFVIPEPNSLTLIGLGIFALAAYSHVCSRHRTGSDFPI